MENKFISEKCNIAYEHGLKYIELCKCKLCCRQLKSERSIKLGYGNTCLKKSGLVIKKGKVKAMRLDKWK